MNLKIRKLLIAGILLFGTTNSLAAELQSLNFSALPGERFEVSLGFSDTPVVPKNYTIEQPARIVLDFPGVVNSIEQKKHDLSFANGKSVVILAGGDRTRLVLNLIELVEYKTRIEGNRLILEVGKSASGDYIKESGLRIGSADSQASLTSDAGVSVKDIDFRRGENGEGRIIVSLSDASVDVDVDQSRGNIVVRFMGANLPDNLQRRLDVTDFATPVLAIDAIAEKNETRLVIDTKGEYDYLSYQTDNEYVVSIKALSETELEKKKSRFAYTGEKLSLNFQNIDVRSVLQLIADFTNLNLVASDTVQGSITLRLDNVPWDQALELVLKAKGLDKRQIGNVLMVAPAAEIAERERQEIETQQQLEELAPLRTEFIRIRYADAKELFDLFGGSGGGGEGEGSQSSGSILSVRGKVIVDDRTNTIILTDTEEKISEFLNLIAEIDRPIPQVLIEARIVIANSDFREEMGVRWGMAGYDAGSSSVTNFAGGTSAFITGNPSDGVSAVDLASITAVDLGLSPGARTGSLAASILKNGLFVDMELSALQADGFGEIVSQPKVITGDKQTASIESGTEIPYQEASSSGATSTSFKEAVLKLEVTPQITPDDNIIMDLIVNQDSVGAIDLASGIPTIDVTELKTQVLAGNGQTIVLGGIYQTEKSHSERKVPFLGDLPVIGRLFRKDVEIDERREVLMFITPKILTDPLRNK